MPLCKICNHLCKICNEAIVPICSFGKMPIANGFLTEAQFEGEYFFELAVGFCEHCKTFQLLYTPDNRQLFHDHYVFCTSGSQTMVRHFERMASDYKTVWLAGKQDPFVVELGSNDGSMLRHLAADGIRHLGVEPSANVAEISNGYGVRTKNCLFNHQTAAEIVAEYAQADLISCSNVHFVDMNSTAKGIAALLKRDGIFVFEDPYLGNLIQNVAYDQIYDEHAYIFSLNAIKSIFEPVGMEIFHVEQYPTYGGSMRYFIGFKGEHQIDANCLEQWERENRLLKLDCVETYQQFAQHCEQRKQETVQLLTGLKKQGKRIVGYGAPSKSTTVLNYCDIGCDILDCIYDTTRIKQGKFSPGKHIPIRAFTNNWFQGVDDALLFIWNHKQEVLEKEISFRQTGGQWIILTPTVCVL